MPISDILWACPACGEDRGLARDPRACTACGIRFARGDQATIRAVAPDGTETVRSADAWLERLPDVESLLDHDPIRTARVSIRHATGEAKVFGDAGFLNRIEIFGDEIPGTLTLHHDRLTVAPEVEGQGEGQGDRPEVWPIETLTAVQTSSKSLQLKRRGHPLVSFTFVDDSIFLWERLVRAALREFYGRTGRGEIVEFQPRIATRRSLS